MQKLLYSSCHVIFNFMLLAALHQVIFITGTSIFLLVLSLMIFPNLASLVLYVSINNFQNSSLAESTGWFARSGRDPLVTSTLALT